MTGALSAELIENGAAVRVTWPDGWCARFHAEWLRFNAQDAETVSPENGQRLIALADIPAGVAAAEVRAAGGAVTLTFSPENKTVTFSAAWLRAHIYDREFPAVPGALPPHAETWDGALDLSEVTARYDDVRGGGAALCNWLAAVRRRGFAVLTGGPVKSGALLDVAALFGYVRETNYGKVFEVRTEPNPANLAYTGLGLPAHTDNPYRDPAPTMQILYCLENSAQGGENRVVDGFRAAQRLRDEDADAFGLLARHAADFAYAHGGAHLSARRPVIELAPGGELAQVRVNNRSAAPATGVPYDSMAAWLRALRRFEEITEDPAMAVPFKLNPGECFMVDNTRVLHGRAAYAASGGTRRLQGCYPDKDGLLSTLAGLEAG